MSTRAIIDIYDEQNKQICEIYHHFDGDTLGRKLEAMLAETPIVNGLRSSRKVANGMPDLAAQVVAHLKDGPGNVYLYAPGTGCDHADRYVIRFAGFDQCATIEIFARDVTYYDPVTMEPWMTDEQIDDANESIDAYNELARERREARKR